MQELDEKVLVNCFNNILRKHDFQGKSRTWSRASEDVICFINLQRLRSGPMFYVNLGVFIHVLANGYTPKPHTCQIQWRLDELVGDRSTDDPYSSISDNRLRVKFNAIVKQLRDDRCFVETVAIRYRCQRSHSGESIDFRSRSGSRR